MHAESIRLALQMGEGFEEMGVFEIEGMGLGLGNGRESAVDVGGFIENWECTGIRMGIGAVGVGVEQGEEIGGNCCCHWYWCCGFMEVKVVWEEEEDEKGEERVNVIPQSGHRDCLWMRLIA